MDQELLREAEGLGINLSLAAETTLRQAVTDAASWKCVNTEALADSNEWSRSITFRSKGIADSDSALQRPG